MITGKSEPKILTKDIPCKRKCKFDGRKHNQIKSEIMINADVNVKKHKYEKDYIWNPAICSCENGKYLASIIDDDSVIMCDEIITKKNYSNKF